MAGKVESYWQVLAIVFMVLFAVSTLLLVLILALGASEIAKEQACSDHCIDLEYADTFFYDDDMQVCYCYDADGETIDRSSISSLT